MLVDLYYLFNIISDNYMKSGLFSGVLLSILANNCSSY